MQMDEGLDTGDVLLQRALAVAPADTAETLAPRLAALGGEALAEALALAQAGRLVPVRQDPARATLAPILSRDDGKIDWTRSAKELVDRLRGFTPWPGAWTTLEGKVVKVLEAEALEATEAGRAAELPPSPPMGGVRPGTATLVPGRGLAVACGHGAALLVRRVQPEGKAPQASADFANGLRRRELAFGT
jgi:methionyl-tRNA formyltransferase